MIDEPQRDTYIGSSDAAPIIGVSSYRSPHEVWQRKVDKLFGEPTVQMPTPKGGVLERGNILEPVILDAFQRESGLTVLGRQDFLQLLDRPYIGGHIDGRASDGGVVEAKSVAIAKEDEWGKPDTSEIAEEHYPQVQHLMGLASASHCWVPVMFIGAYGIRYHTYCVDRDSAFIDDLFKAEMLFWQYVQNREPPPPTVGDDVQRRWPKDNGLILDCNETVATDVALLRMMKAHLKAKADEAAEIEGRIKLAVGDASGLRYGGKIICTYKQQNRAGYTVADTSFRVLRTPTPK